MRNAVGGRIGRALLGFLLAVLLGACTTAKAPANQRASPSVTPASPSPSPAPPPLIFDASRAMDHARVLSVEIGKRVAGTQGEEKAAQYIELTMKAAQLDVSRQRFTRADDGMSANIVGRISGADYSKGYLLVGGHFDTLGESPGGNDNGSGTAVVLTLAEHFGESAGGFSQRRVPIEFVAFAAEEVDPDSKKHHEGSLAYAESLSNPATNLAMLSIDMVGNGPDLKIVGWRGHQSPLTDELAAIATEIGIPHQVIVKGDISDHTSFLRKGVPASMLWSGDHPSLHKASDTFDVVQVESVERTGRLTLEWLRRRNGLV